MVQRGAAAARFAWGRGAGRFSGRGRGTVRVRDRARRALPRVRRRRCLRVLRVQQPHRVPAELGDQRAGQPGVAGAAVGDGVLGARAGQHLGQGRAGGGVLLQAVAHEVGDALGHPVEVGLLLGDAEHQGVHAAVGGAEGQGAGGGVGDDGTEAEDVAGGRDAVAAHLLGRHEAGRADQRAGAGESAVGHRLQGACDAEVDDAGAVDGDEDVGRLEVAVDDPGGVDVLEGVGEPGRQGPHRAFRQGAVVVADDLLEAGPGHVPGGDPGHGGLGVGVQHGRRPVAADPPGGLHLLAEPLPELLLGGQFLPDQLHGDRAAAVRTGQIDVAHAARAQSSQQPVGPDAPRVPVPELLHVAPPSPRT